VATSGRFGQGISGTLKYMVAINIPVASLEAAREEARNSIGKISTEGSADAGTIVTYAADSGSQDTSQRVARGRPFVTPARVILNQNPFGIFAVEVVLGWCAFLGAGWLKSRRPAMALLLFTFEQTFFWVSLWGLLTLLAPDYLPYFVAAYITLPIVSGIVAARTYVKQAERLKRELSLIVDAPKEAKVTGNKVN
jgi:hypothetical protein